MKEPHNHRKVGYSMIVISVSLTMIGLVTWSIGSNYHYGTGLMAGQEIDAMTPKQGYNIISFDQTAPVGAKLKLLDHTDSINETKKLQDQYQQSNKGFQILIFGNSSHNNLDLMARAEIAALTPTQGYTVILFNNAMPVGAKLTMSENDNSLVNATKYEQQQKSQITDPDVSVIIFSSSYENNLITVLGSGSPSAISAQPVQNILSATPSNASSVTNTGAMTSNPNNESATITPKLNAINNTSSPQTGQATLTLTEKVNATTNTNQTATNGTHKSVNISENVVITTK